MAVYRRYDIVAILVAVLGIVAYASFSVEFRLRPGMPVEFFDPSQVAPAKRAAEEKLARAYWQCAVKQIQWKYGYAHRLPEEPPVEFSVAAADAGSGAHDSAARARYWQRLRAAWEVPALWEEQYEWNAISFKDSLHSAGQWLELHMRRIVGYE